MLTLSVFAAGTFLPGASQADDPPGCPGLYCLWTKKNFNGKRFVVDTRQLVNFPDFIDDKASSLKWDLPEGKVLHLYERRNGHGPSASVCGKNSAPEFEPALNDSFSSAEVTNGSCV
jgi:hypothetical protein